MATAIGHHLKVTLQLLLRGSRRPSQSADLVSLSAEGGHAAPERKAESSGAHSAHLLGRCGRKLGGPVGFGSPGSFGCRVGGLHEDPRR
jgi:hypothetical protein